MPSDAVVEGVSGAIGGIIATIATYPLMTITTRRVTSRTSAPAISAPAGTQQGEIEAATPATPPTKPPRQVSTIEELLRTIRTSGWTSLFPGLGASLVGTTVSQGVYFYLYSILRQAAVRRRSSTNSRLTDLLADTRSAEVTVAESLFVAALAGMGNVLLTNPIWMIATRMQAHQKRTTTTATGSSSTAGSNKNTSTSQEDREKTNTASTSTGNIPSTSSEDSSSTATRKPATATKHIPAGVDVPAPGPVAVAREVYAEYGLGGFWNGVGASLVMVINPTIQYAFYEWLVAARGRVKRQNKNASGRLSAGEVFLLSAIAKAGATVLTYPLLTVKTRMMSARKSDAHMQYASIFDAIKQIAVKEGLSGYYRGIQTKIVQSVLAAALLFMCKEKITDFTRDLLTGRQRNAVVLAALVVQQASQNNKAVVR